ncbi:MAG: SMI1/KNR4 family protein [Pseudobdellovibrionaceae bacterium]|nr:SMI1/KNR4 family protein [Pseudobdellovibrionaceae bacterium]
MFDFKERFYKHEKNCSQNDIENFEKLINFKLPESYKSFLLEVNGGIPENMLLFPFVNKKGKSTHESIQRFYGLLDENVGLKYQFELYHKQQKRMPTGLIPIGHDGGGNKICLLVSDIGYGKIYFWEHDDEVDFDDDEEALEPMRNTHLVADSFIDFVSKLTEDTDD